MRNRPAGETWFRHAAVIAARGAVHLSCAESATPVSLLLSDPGGAALRRAVVLELLKTSSDGHHCRNGLANEQSADRSSKSGC
jgi:hypothetical protein